MELFNIHYLLFFCIYCIVFIGADDNQKSSCAPGLLTAGVTLPKGDIIIEHGNPLEIFCILNPNESNLNSSSLVFYHDNIKVTKDFLNIVNETSLRLYVKYPPISTSLYSCKLQTENREEGVCHNYVYVGTKPQPVMNFTCISHNWEGISCSWLPVENPVHTIYRLSFSLRGKTRHIFKCPGNTDISHNYCLWDSTTNPPHRMPHDEYFFNLVGENVFGNISTKYKINHYGVVLPRKPENLALVQATPYSLTISWDLPLALKEFPVKVVNKVLYQSSWDPIDYWQQVNISTPFKNREQHILNITGLKYAHTLYDIRVLLRSSLAENIEKWWSEPATITIRTKPTVPAVPPETVIGSFESIPRASDSHLRNIFIYWQIIPRQLENGENFSYKISSIEEVVNEIGIQRNNTYTIDKYYALFENMTYNKYIFKIVSSNKEGISQIYSTIVVPSKTGSPDHPVTFTKIFYNQGVYELSWNAPPQNNVTSNNYIKNYTIFWCDNKYDRPYSCNGVLNWTVVSNNVTEKNITLDVKKSYQFAISANTIYSSSGMVWAHCTVLPDQGRGKLKYIWINRIGSNFMELYWKLDCLHSPINGFLVEYCPVPFPRQTECKEKEIRRERFNGDLHAAHYNISSLKPYTTYMVRLSLISTKDSLISSDLLFNTTLEAAPDGPPEKIRALEVTNNSVTLAWKQPSALNGVLRNYKIYWNSSYTLIENKSEFVQFTLSNLSSFEDYVIRVIACTVACSDKAATLVIRTLTGKPAQLNPPAVSFYNNTYLNIKWFPLKKQCGGRNDYYQIKVQMLNEHKDTVLNETIKRYDNVKGGKEGAIEILIPGCQEAEISAIYRVQVRAVNKDFENLQIFEGPWSLPAEGICRTINTTGLSVMYRVLISAVGVLLVFVLCVFIGAIARYSWMHFKAMQDINVKLPPQLELGNEINKNNTLPDIPMNESVRPQFKCIGDNSTPNPLSDQLVATIKEEYEETSTKDVNKEGETSDCPHYESISSIISPKSHITDLETDTDVNSEDAFSESPMNEYQKQKDVSRSEDSSEVYSKLAQAPSGYVSLPSGVSNYVRHDMLPKFHAEVRGINESTLPPNV